MMTFVRYPCSTREHDESRETGVSYAALHTADPSQEKIRTWKSCFPVRTWHFGAFVYNTQGILYYLFLIGYKHIEIYMSKISKGLCQVLKQFKEDRVLALES